MIRTSDEQRQYDEDATAVFEQLKAVGRQYGRAIMTAVLGADQDVDQINAGMEAALADTREFLETNGICDNDVEVSLSGVRAAISRKARPSPSCFPTTWEVFSEKTPDHI